MIIIHYPPFCKVDGIQDSFNRVIDPLKQWHVSSTNLVSSVWWRGNKGSHGIIGYGIDLAAVPLTVFRSNPKFDHILECSNLKYVQPITTKFCTRHNSYVCKISLWSAGYILNQSTSNVGFISNSIGISIVGRSPDSHVYSSYFIREMLLYIHL